VIPDFDDSSPPQKRADENVTRPSDMSKAEDDHIHDTLNETIHDMEFGRNNVSVLGTCFNIFKCFIGIGLLAIPSAFSHVTIRLSQSL
jgi:hypothetical protein